MNVLILHNGHALHIKCYQKDLVFIWIKVIQHQRSRLRGVSTATLDNRRVQWSLTVVVLQKPRPRQKVWAREERSWSRVSVSKKHTGFVIGFMTGATIGSVIIVIAINQSWGWVFLCSWSFHTFSARNYGDGGTCQVCTVCLCKTPSTQPSRQISTAIRLSAVSLIVLLKASWWLRFPMQEEKSYLVWSRRQKYGQHNRISSLVSAILPHRDIPMGTRFCCANHSQISAGPFLIWTWKKGRWREVLEKKKERGEEEGLSWES